MSRRCYIFTKQKRDITLPKADEIVPNSNQVIFTLVQCSTPNIKTRSLAIFWIPVSGSRDCVYIKSLGHNSAKKMSGIISDNFLHTVANYMTKAVLHIFVFRKLPKTGMNAKSEQNLLKVHLAHKLY